MKKFVIITLLILVAVGVVFMNKLSFKDNTKTSYLRIHIRANSNLAIDQNVKYKVKDKVVDYLTPLFVNCTTKQQAQDILSDNLSNIESVANKVLKDNGFDYLSHAKLNNEYFPTRAYGEYVLEDGYYDALILELGSGTGDNWWCVIYPPLCFVDNSQNIEYKSRFLEIIKKII